MHNVIVFFGKSIYGRRLSDRDLLVTGVVFAAKVNDLITVFLHILLDSVRSDSGSVSSCARLQEAVQTTVMNGNRRVVSPLRHCNEQNMVISGSQLKHKRWGGGGQ